MSKIYVTPQGVYLRSTLILPKTLWFDALTCENVSLHLFRSCAHNKITISFYFVNKREKNKYIFLSFFSSDNLFTLLLVFIIFYLSTILLVSFSHFIFIWCNFVCALINLLFTVLIWLFFIECIKIISAMYVYDTNYCIRLLSTCINGSSNFNVIRLKTIKIIKSKAAKNKKLNK